MSQIEALISLLDKIAKKNKDEFKYTITIDRHRSGLWFTFCADETAEGHSFTSGSGPTIEQAILDAEDSIPEALEAWGYKL